MQTFDCNIVNDLVIGTLQEGRVNGRYRHQSLCRHTGRHTDGVLLGDADIEKAFREFLGKAGQARAGRHSCRDRTNAVVLLSECAKLLAEERRKILLLRGKRCACYAVELGNAVVFLRILLTRGIASTLLCHNMQQNRFFHFFRQCQKLAHAFEVVSVHRT